MGVLGRSQTEHGREVGEQHLLVRVLLDSGDHLLVNVLLVALTLFACLVHLLLLREDITLLFLSALLLLASEVRVAHVLWQSNVTDVDSCPCADHIDLIDTT